MVKSCASRRRSGGVRRRHLLGYYTPKNVIVLCDAGTLSAGFSVVVEFWRLGATTVGRRRRRLRTRMDRLRSSISGTPAQGHGADDQRAHFPDDPSRRTCCVDHLLTHERFKAFGFDPHAEYLYALTLR